MAYPTDIDSLTRPGSGQPLSSPSGPAVIDELADAIEAVEGFVGTSTETSASTIRGLLADTTNGHTHDGVDSAASAPSPHAHDGVDASGQIDHTDLTAVGADDHHNETHAVGGAGHTGVMNLQQQDEYFVALASDQTWNTDAETDPVTDLDFDVEASATYVFEFVLIASSADNADIKIELTGPASPTAIWYQFIGPTQTGTGGGALNQQQNADVASAFTTELAAGGANSGNRMYLVKGVLVNGANAGTVVLEAAQNTSQASNTVIRAGSYLVAKRVA